MLIVVFFTVANVFAHDFEVDGIYYNITNISEKTVAVTYKGTNALNRENYYKGDIIIPESVKYNNEKYIITSIGDNAFSLCDGVESIEIPNTVINIGEDAFNCCYVLSNITLSNSVVTN